MMRPRPPVNHVIDPDVQEYGARLAAVGTHPREVARAVFYAQAFGLESLTGPECVLFGEPFCGEWNCLSPDHQTLVKG